MRRLFRNRPSRPRGGFTNRVRTPHSRTREARENLNELMAEIDPTHPNYPIEESEVHERHTWSPRADFIEKEREYVVQLELPGVAKEDTRLEQHNDVLHVYGVRRERFNTEHRVTSQESEYGPFSRTIPLPADVERENISASYRQGVLTIQLPRTSKSDVRRIEVA